MRFLLIVLISISLHVSGQRIFPLYGNDFTWHVMHKSYFNMPNWFKNETVLQEYLYDTTFCGHTYSRANVFPIVTSIFNWIVYMRVDSQKVVYRHSGQNSYTTNMDCMDPEKIAYDFSLGVGDSIEIEYMASMPNRQYKVDSILIEGTPGRKALYLSGGYFPEKWLEGIGSIIHPFYFVQEDNLSNHADWWLYCADSSGVSLYGPKLMSCDTSWDAFTGVEMSSKPQLKIQPNPTTGKFAIEFESSIPELTLSIYSSQGQVISKETHTSKSTIQTEIKGEPGLYFIELIFKDGHRLESKVVKN